MRHRLHAHDWDHHRLVVRVPGQDVERLLARGDVRVRVLAQVHERVHHDDPVQALLHVRPHLRHRVHGLDRVYDLVLVHNHLSSIHW